MKSVHSRSLRCRNNDDDAGSKVILCNVNWPFHSPDISVIPCLTFLSFKISHTHPAGGKEFSAKSREGVRILKLRTQGCEVTQDINKPGE